MCNTFGVALLLQCKVGFNFSPVFQNTVLNSHKSFKGHANPDPEVRLVKNFLETFDPEMYG